MSKTFIVYIPTGGVFVTADGYRVHYDDNVVVFYNTDDILMVPVAQFMLNNIYGWSESHA